MFATRHSVSANPKTAYQRYREHCESEALARQIDAYAVALHYYNLQARAANLKDLIKALAAAMTESGSVGGLEPTLRIDFGHELKEKEDELAGVIADLSKPPEDIALLLRVRMLRDRIEHSGAQLDALKSTEESSLVDLSSKKSRHDVVQQLGKQLSLTQIALAKDRMGVTYSELRRWVRTGKLANSGPSNRSMKIERFIRTTLRVP